MKTESLLRLTGPWIHVLAASNSDACNAMWSLERDCATKVLIRQVRGHKAKTLTAMFDEFAAALQFPSYFGENWAAFDECLNDLEWLPADAYILFVLNASRVLEGESLHDLNVLFTIFQRAGQEWAETRKKAFHVILHVEEQDVELLSGKLRANKELHFDKLE